MKGLARRFLILLLLLQLIPVVLAADDSTANSTWPAADPVAIEHWRSLRFGMFIHWGPVSLTGEEIGWSRGSQTPIDLYDQLYKKFNPLQFDAEKWAATAQAAGMKYVVLVTKHHDGFCMWDTKQTDFNIMNSPFHRDVVGELSKAFRQKGIAFGVYYSTCDWHHPDFPLTSPGGSVRRPKSDLDSYNRYLLAQVKELVTQYGPLLTVWNDVPQEFKGRGANTIKLLRSLQPDIVINDRTGDGGDYDTPEQRVGNYQDTRPWETCMTICHQWSWKPNDGMKSLRECLQTLVKCAGGDGNLLFNVGPTSDGIIETRQVDRLKEMGDWLARNGTSIYGTRGGPWKPTADIASTRSGQVIYLHVLNPASGEVNLPDPGRKVKSAAQLDGHTVVCSQNDGRLVLKFAPATADAIDNVIRLELDGSAMDLPAIAVK